MTNTVVRKTGIVLGFAAALLVQGGRADAAEGQTGTRTLSKEWGPYYWGPGKSTAQLDFYFGTKAEWVNSADAQYAVVQNKASTSTWGDAYLFSKRYIFWDLEGTGFAIRSANGAQDFNYAYAKATILINNYSYFNTTVYDYTKAEADTTSQPFSYSQRIGKASGKFWLGPIPFSASGEVWGSLGITTGAVTTMAVNNADPTWTQFDASYGSISGAGNVWGSGFVAIGDPGIVGIGVSGSLNFVSASVTPEAIAFRALCSFKVAGCTGNNRVSVSGRVKGPINLTSGSGKIDVFGAVAGASISKNIISWKNPLTYNTMLWDDSLVEQFKGFI